MNKKPDNEKGMVLVAAIVFLLIINLLVINLLITGLLETKMSKYYQNKAQSFYLAEQKLEKCEQEILADKKTAEVIEDGICGITFYRVIATAKYHEAFTKLQSTIAKVDEIAICNPKPNIKSGRQSFLVIGDNTTK